MSYGMAGVDVHIACRARGRGSGDGINGAILETHVESAGRYWKPIREKRKARTVSREHFIWPMRSLIVGDGVVRRISSTPNA